MKQVTLIARCRTQRLGIYAKAFYFVICFRLIIGTFWAQPDQQHILEKHRFHHIRCLQRLTFFFCLLNKNLIEYIVIHILYKHEVDFDHFSARWKQRIFASWSLLYASPDHFSYQFVRKIIELTRWRLNCINFILSG